MVRRLVQIGSSLAVTLPSDTVKKYRLKKGQLVEVSEHPITGALTIRPGVLYAEDGKVTPRFRKRAEELLRRREALYKALAK